MRMRGVENVMTWAWGGLGKGYMCIYIYIHITICIYIYKGGYNDDLLENDGTW